MTLYEYDEKIPKCVNQETGEVDFEALEQLQMERDEKIENMLLWIKDLKAEANAIAEEVTKLQARKSACMNKAESIKNYLIMYLNGEKFKTPRVAVSYTHSKSVEIDDIFQIPEQYLKYSDPTADKVALKKDIQMFGTIPGCHIEEKQSMVIK